MITQEMTERSAKTRGQRARLKKRVASGAVPVSRILAEPPPCLRPKRGRPVTVAEILEWQKKVGPDRSRRILLRAHLDPDVELMALPSYRRRQLAESLSVPSGV